MGSVCLGDCVGSCSLAAVRGEASSAQLALLRDTEVGRGGESEKRRENEERKDEIEGA